MGIENNKVRVRFAPSPTGEPHIGNLRTALFNYLYARKTGGIFVLRIDDTDLSRTAPGAEQAVFESLRWLGLEWDEGPEAFEGGEATGALGPYRQSERLSVYKKYLDLLLEQGAAYFCFCREEELELERQIAIKSGKPYRYSGKCRNLSEDQKKYMLERGGGCSVRLKVMPGSLKFRDKIRGEMNASANDIGDFIIRRSDQIPTYNFTCVIDDHLMEMSMVIRAEDHLYNTFTQLLLYRALGFEPPEFAHLSLILGADRKPLSKREQASSIRFFQEKGYLSEALVNYLALLGFSHPDAKEFLKKDELVRSFKLERVSKSAAVFDLARLDWLNRKHIRDLSGAELISRSADFLKAAGAETGGLDADWLARAADSVKDNISRLYELPQWLKIYLEAPAPDALKESLAGIAPAKEILEKFLAQMENLKPGQTPDQSLFEPLVKSCNKKEVYMAVRYALTARKEGPELVPLIDILGREEVLKRVQAAMG